MSVVINGWTIEVVDRAVIVNGRQYSSLNANAAIMDFFELAGRLLKGE